jgi:hypothetical protein
MVCWNNPTAPGGLHCVLLLWHHTVGSQSCTSKCPALLLPVSTCLLLAIGARTWLVRRPLGAALYVIVLLRYKGRSLLGQTVQRAKSAWTRYVATRTTVVSTPALLLVVGDNWFDNSRLCDGGVRCLLWNIIIVSQCPFHAVLAQDARSCSTYSITIHLSTCYLQQLC